MIHDLNDFERFEWSESLLRFPSTDKKIPSLPSKISHPPHGEGDFPLPLNAFV